MLAASVLVVARADAFLIHAAGETIRFALAGRADPRQLADAAQLGPAALAKRGIVNAVEAAGRSAHPGHATGRRDQRVRHVGRPAAGCPRGDRDRGALAAARLRADDL